MPVVETVTIFSAVFFYSLVLAGQLITIIYSLVKKIDKVISPQSFFNYCVVIFCVLRIGATGTNNANGFETFFLNRMAILVFLTALSITLYTWMAALGIVLAADSGLAAGVRSVLQKLQWIFLIANVAFYIMQIVTIAVYVTQTKADTVGNKWYDASVLLIACAIFIMGVLFAVQSFRLWRESGKCSPQVQDVLLRASVCAAIVAACFTLRFIFLLYRPITNKFIQNDGFFVGCYLIPELIPLFVSLIVHAFRITNTKLNFGYGEREKPRRSGISREDAEAAGFTPRNTKTSAAGAGVAIRSNRNTGGGGGESSAGGIVPPGTSPSTGISSGSATVAIPADGDAGSDAAEGGSASVTSPLLSSDR